MMKAVHFGAGNIGRGFIGQLLADSDYEICFVDSNESLVSRLQEEGAYSIRVVSNHKEEVIEVNGISAVHIQERSVVENKMVEADLITTAVGVQNFPHISPIIAQGLRRRLLESRRPLHIVACENAVAGSEQLKQHISVLLTEEERRLMNTCVSFPDSMVDRIVPEQPVRDSLEVSVEEFYEWVVEQDAWSPELKRIKGVNYVTNLIPYMERKLYTLNTGHCGAAYLGDIHGYDMIHEAMADSQIRQDIENVLLETGQWLMNKHHFDPQAHHSYIQKIIERISNPHLEDSVKRVGRSPLRKLSSGERLVRPALEHIHLGGVPHHLSKCIAAALHFKHPGDEEAVKMREIMELNPLNRAIEIITGVQEDHKLHQSIREHYLMIQDVLPD